MQKARVRVKATTEPAAEQAKPQRRIRATGDAGRSLDETARLLGAFWTISA